MFSIIRRRSTESDHLRYVSRVIWIPFLLIWITILFFCWSFSVIVVVGWAYQRSEFHLLATIPCVKRIPMLIVFEKNNLNTRVSTVIIFVLWIVLLLLLLLNSCCSSFHLICCGIVLTIRSDCCYCLWCHLMLWQDKMWIYRKIVVLMLITLFNCKLIVNEMFVSRLGTYNKRFLYICIESSFFIACFSYRKNDFSCSTTGSTVTTTFRHPCAEKTQLSHRVHNYARESRIFNSCSSILFFELSMHLYKNITFCNKWRKWTILERAQCSHTSEASVDS